MIKAESGFIQIDAVPYFIENRTVPVRIVLRAEQSVYVVLNGISSILCLLQTIIDLDIQLVV